MIKAILESAVREKIAIEYPSYEIDSVEHHTVARTPIVLHCTDREDGSLVQVQVDIKDADSYTCSLWSMIDIMEVGL